MSDYTSFRFAAGGDSDQSSSKGASTEDPLQPRVLECQHDRFYWFGKIFTNCLLAEDVFRNSGPLQTGTAMDANKMRVLNNLPVQECFSKISDGSKFHIPLDLSKIKGDQYTMLMTVIGATIYNGDGETKRTLANIIYSCTSASEPATDHYVTMPPDRPSSPQDSVVGEEIPPVSGDVPSHVFTSKLYEWEKCCRGARLIWGTPIMVNEYQEWEYPLTVQAPGYGSKDFTAVASQKQEAKHQVSKKACKHFHI